MAASRFVNRIPQYVDRTVQKNEGFLLSLALQVYNLSQMQVPYASGDLKKSAHAGPERVKPGKYRISYNTAYARKLHYDTSLRIKKPGRKQFYLEDPVMQVARNVASSAKQAFK